jgi:hypothetical protein
MRRCTRHTPPSPDLRPNVPGSPRSGVVLFVALVTIPGRRPRHGANVAFLWPASLSGAPSSRRLAESSRVSHRPSCRTDYVSRGRGGGGKPSLKREKVPKLPRGVLNAFPIFLQTSHNSRNSGSAFGHRVIDSASSYVDAIDGCQSTRWPNYCRRLSRQSPLHPMFLPRAHAPAHACNANCRDSARQ